MVVEFSLSDFLRGLYDQRRALCIEQAEIVIRLRGRPFNQAQSANEWSRKPMAANRKIEHRAVCRGAMKRMRRKRHLAHRIFFDPPRLLRHADPSAPTLTSPGIRFRSEVRRAWRRGDGVL